MNNQPCSRALVMRSHPLEHRCVEQPSFVSTPTVPHRGQTTHQTKLKQAELKVAWKLHSKVAAHSPRMQRNSWFTSTHYFLPLGSIFSVLPFGYAESHPCRTCAVLPPCTPMHFNHLPFGAFLMPLWFVNS